MKVRFVKVAKVTHCLNWWHRYGIVGQTFEALEISPYTFVKIEYEEGTFGWLPLDACEVNPHLKVVKL